MPLARESSMEVSGTTATSSVAVPCPESLFLRFLGGAFEFAGESAGIGRRQEDGGSDVEAGGCGAGSVRRGRSCTDLGAAARVAGTFDEHALALGDHVREGEDGLGGEGEGGRHPLSIHQVLPSEKALF